LGPASGGAGYSSENYPSDLGASTVVVFAATIFGLDEPKPSVANQALINAAVCPMLDKPLPAATGSSPRG
jgi:D-alanyl-D-alanine carboxypeptidase